MKVISTVAVTLGLIATVNAEHTERKLIIGGSIVPTGSKTYMTGIRATPEGNTFCGAALVSPTHVLTTATCNTFGQPNYVAIGAHYINGKKEGEQIKVVKVQNHTKYNYDSGTYDFALLTLEKPSKFAPVKLPKADDSDIKAGIWSTVMGWGETSYPNGTVSNELRQVSLEVWDNQECSHVYNIDDTMVCAGGVAGKDSCSSDSGGPLVKELKAGDADDVVIGLSSWGQGCAQEGIPSVYARVSTAVEWINSVTKNSSCHTYF